MIDKLLSFLQLFKHIPADDQAIIARAFETKEFNEGDYLFKGGKVCQSRFFICDGVLRIVVHNEKGNEVTHYFLKENQFCTILNSFNNLVPAHESIQAACKTTILEINRTRLLALYEQLPYLKELIDEITQQALIDKVQIRNAYLGQDSTTRYKLFLMRQADIALRVPLNDIASYLGITPQSLSRIRKNIR
ncbi:cAMP-binding domain of CRP or a regulatory subunit of cAMP-dependent protein kinases [Mucilaginibacter pineti]|uniref:cAMP-binding domain of CRP or a regulatory subunit of cAMP-dependent protein kinases n=1 Tax=Mucilaginibacter pineti TaxID=1391627 RepID=A0A1G6T9L5_9SPHI|nr:Crp/Fnr family transcriptional regulator [Mucilaginibacter pineti]SDD25544.1 cAMP-binding domain of CRP or a regulatory subunit of cAMP-dependent protein kinases [Mucilaginibacter pineti]